MTSGTLERDAAVAAAVALWVDRSGQVIEDTTTRASQAALAGWAEFEAWYDLTKISEAAGQAAEASLVAQEIAAHQAAGYVGQVLAAMLDTRQVEIPSIGVPQIRGGVDPVRVHSRPAYVYRETFAVTGDEDRAREAAIAREMELIEADIMLAARGAERDAYQEVKGVTITRYRRVLRPELAKTGSCGLCIAAADQVYSVKDLLPIHERCNCRTMPIVDDLDPAAHLNTTDLYHRVLKETGGSTKGADLKKVRYQVREHGEYGPVLTVRGQKFTGPEAVGRGVTPEQAEKQLAALRPVLDRLVERAAQGEDVTSPLDYQRRLIAKLERILAAG